MLIIEFVQVQTDIFSSTNFLGFYFALLQQTLNLKKKLKLFFCSGYVDKPIFSRFKHITETKKHEPNLTVNNKRCFRRVKKMKK